VKKHASDPGGIATVVWRSPVTSPAPIGGDEPIVTGVWALGPTRIGGSWPAHA
jgi:hypothetical protein